MKFYNDFCWNRIIFVAPFVGAWIEINSSAPCSVSLPVAPFVGAWIEIWNVLG